MARPTLARTALAVSTALAAALVGCAADQAARSADAGPTTDGSPTDAGEIASDGGPTDGAATTAPDADATPDDATPAEDAGMSTRTIHAYGALGSSSTAGAGATAPERAYVPLLHARLAPFGAGAIALVNRGQGGARIDTLLAALPDLERERPELVTILPLTDFVQTDLARFRSGYDELFRRLEAVGTTVFFGDLRIDPAYLCDGGQSGPGGCYGEQDRALLGGKNAVVAELAAQHPGVTVVPVFDQNAAHPEWNAPDGHPNDLGHQYLADTFWAAIGPWLGR